MTDYFTNLKMPCSAMISDDSPNRWSTFDYERVLEVLKSLHPNICGFCYHMWYNHIFDGQITICIKNKKQQPLKDSKTWQTKLFVGCTLLYVPFRSHYHKKKQRGSQRQRAPTLRCLQLPSRSLRRIPHQSGKSCSIFWWHHEIFRGFLNYGYSPSHSFSHWLYI